MRSLLKNKPISAVPKPLARSIETHSDHAAEIKKKAIEDADKSFERIRSFLRQGVGPISQQK